MPGVYVGEFVVLRAPADGTLAKHDGKTRWERAGDLVYLHVGDRFVMADQTISFPRPSREGRPYIELEST